ncbi:hypothetical protein [Proteus hauseri]|uniref:hypothetical protein n=1 Tax=Proteus hauseri TaxID=183417 RepID=UPI0032DA4186
MNEIQISVIKKLSKQRRKLYVRSSINLAKLDKQLSTLIPILNETIDEIKKKQQQKDIEQNQFKKASQFFEYLTENDKRENAIYALEYLLFCFDNGCKVIKKVIRRELKPLVQGIEHLIDFELKKVIKPSWFALFNGSKV